MNICIFSHGHFSKLRGGTECVTLILAKEFIKAGHNVYLISTGQPIKGDKTEKNQYFIPNIDVTSSQNVDFVSYFFSEKEIELIINQSIEKELLNLIIKCKKDIPCINCIHNNPLVFIKSITDYWSSCKIKYGWKFYAFYLLFIIAFTYFRHKAKKKTREELTFIYKNSDAVVLLSDKYKKIFQDVIGIKNCDKLYAIPNPLLTTNSKRFEKENLVIFVGRLEFQKRVDRLLAVWKNIYNQHNNWELKIIGDGNSRQLFESISNKYQLKNVEFVGKTFPDEYYKKASILCVASSHEGLPMVILEALQYEVIPIAFNSFESLEDVITDKYNGIIIDAFSIKKYSRALDRLMGDENLLKEMRNNINAFNKVETFSIKAITTSWENLFCKIIKHNECAC